MKFVAEMVDEVEYLPLYEVVDHQQQIKSTQPSVIKPQARYEPLSSAAQKLNVYQQLETESSHHVKMPDMAHEFKIFKRDLRLTKIAVAVGLLLLTCLVAAGVVVTTVIAVHPTISQSNSTSFSSQITTVDSKNYSGLPQNVFQNCQQETQSCDIMHHLENRATCNTGTLQFQKEVSD